jgi:adenylyltransferase/sulfurtransferase
LGVLPGIVGCIQAMETIKLIIGQGQPLIGRLLVFDALGVKFRELKLRKDPDCPVCGRHPTITRLIDYEQFCGVRGEEHTSMMTGIPEITPGEVKKMMDEKQPFALIDVREPHEFQICRMPGSKLIPLGEVPKRMHELDSTQEIVVHCRSGQRSARAVELLMKAGFRKIHNLKGGILAWSDQVDRSVPKY